MICEIPAQSGVAVRLATGQRLRVIDPRGEQVSGLLTFNADDTAEVISSGRSLDYAGKIYLTTDDLIYSNRRRNVSVSIGASRSAESGWAPGSSSTNIVRPRSRMRSNGRAARGPGDRPSG
jgi:uncharacterized protein YcgI (DUF1989 family)